MSGPFVYNPGVKLSAAPASPSPYVKKYYGHPNVSPFMPPAQLVPSPIIPNPGLPGYYAAPANLVVPGTPAKSVHFADESCPALARPRSWHASDFPQQIPGWVTPTGGVVPVLPPSPAAVPVFLSPPSMGHHRRHSFGQGQAPQWYQPASPWPHHHAGMALAVPSSPPEPKIQIHPYLDGKNVRQDFYFDLSAPEFIPQRRYPNGTLATIPDAELDEPATHPGIKQMTITAEGVSQWPIVLKPTDAPSPIMGLGLNVPSWVEGSSDDVKPITLRDVLLSIWSVMQTQISHLDWGKLSTSEEHAVSRAYTRRCKTALQFGEEVAINEQNLGVKRIDFLLDKHMFRGLKPAKGSEGFENMVMVLSARQSQK